MKTENIVFFEEGENNQMIGGSIKIRGKNNRIIIKEKSILNNFYIDIESDDNIIEINKGCRISGKLVMKLSNRNKLLIGENVTVGGANFICGEETTIKIGNDCMIAWGIEFRTTDSHAIIDTITNERINFSQDIEIGNHVWIGAHSTILKGVNISENSIIGIRSLVPSGLYDANSIYAGVPVKKIRSNINWDRKLLG